MTTTCQICGRAIKASTGRIAHHGYRHPWAQSGDHSRTTSCPGSRHLPYEVSRELIPHVRRNYEDQRSSLLATTTAFETSPPETLTVVRKDSWGTRAAVSKLSRPDGFDPASPRRSYLPLGYDTEYHARLRTMRHDLAALTEAIAFLTERYDNWRAVA